MYHQAKRDNGNVHRAAANIIVSKSRAARGSVCNVSLSIFLVSVSITDRALSTVLMQSEPHGILVVVEYRLGVGATSFVVVQRDWPH